MKVTLKILISIIIFFSISNINAQSDLEGLFKKIDNLLVEQESLTDSLIQIAISDSLYTDEEKHKAVTILGKVNTLKANRFLLENIDERIPVKELLKDDDQIREWACFHSLSTNQERLESFNILLLLTLLEQERSISQLRFYADLISKKYRYSMDTKELISILQKRYKNTTLKENLETLSTLVY